MTSAPNLALQRKRGKGEGAGDKVTRPVTVFMRTSIEMLSFCLQLPCPPCRGVAALSRIAIEEETANLLQRRVHRPLTAKLV